MVAPIDNADRETTPRGKIGRLPHALRRVVNQMLRDNKTAEEIIAWLATQGIEEAVSPQNISAWKMNGYTKWLREQERIERMQATVEYAERFVNETGSKGMTVASDAAARMAVNSIIAVLDNFEPTLLSAALADKPALFTELVHAISSLRKGDQAAVLLQQKVDAYERAAKKLHELADENGVATKADIQGIFKEAYGL